MLLSALPKQEWAVERLVVTPSPANSHQEQGGRHRGGGAEQGPPRVR